MFADLPDKRYNIVYADPPWLYASADSIQQVSCLNKRDGGHYPVVHLEDLKQLDVMSVAEDDCLLFMWAASPKLDEAIELGLAWGFQYVTIGFVWEKGRPNAGSYTLSSVELCLIFKHGRIPQPRGARNVRQFLAEIKQEHSVKPYEVRRRIELMFPSQSKLELFGRRRFDGWDVWGNDERLSLPTLWES